VKKPRQMKPKMPILPPAWTVVGGATTATPGVLGRIPALSQAQLIVSPSQEFVGQRDVQ